MKKIILIIITVFLGFSYISTYATIGDVTDADMDKAKKAAGTDGWSKSCIWSGKENSFCSDTFEIKVDTFTPNKETFVLWGSSKDNMKNFFEYVISDLLVALWVVALLIMSIGAGYMIFYHGQDEYLSKWKSIFMAWVVALVVALSSYYLVSLLRYILYS